MILYIYKRDTVFYQLEKENAFYPTVYTLWKYPKMLPVLTTHVPVMSRIANGADLMLPGVIIDESKAIKAYCDGKLEKNDTVSINLANNLAPIAVGKAFRSSEDMYLACRHGKAVDILHSFGDQLWAAGTRVEVPDLGLPVLPQEIQEYSEENEESPTSSEENKEEGEEGDSNDNTTTAANNNTTTTTANDNNENQEVEQKLEDLNLKEEALEDLDPRSDSEKMDELLSNAFLQAWKTSAKKIDFPILTSNFFRLHMVPQAPPGVTLDLKKSSHKKLSKFLARMEKKGIIKIKELQKG